MAIPKPKK